MDMEQRPVNKPNHCFTIKYRKINIRQANALIPGNLILLAVGCCLLPILYHGFLVIGFESRVLTFNTMFFVGNIIGTATGAFLLRKINKKKIYYVCAALTWAAGILKIAKGQVDRNDINDMHLFLNVHTASNFFIGVAFGICLLTNVIYAGEISVKYLRGSHTLNIQIFIDIGILIAIEIYAIIRNLYLLDAQSLGLSEVLATGIVMNVASVIGLLVVYFVVVESPAYLIKKGDEAEARKNLLRFRRTGIETSEIMKDFDEMKQIIRGSDMNNQSRNFIGKFIQFKDLIPLVKVLLLRVAYLLGTAAPINTIMLAFVQAVIKTPHYALPLILLKLIGETICVFTIDRYGRKPLLIISLGSAGILAVIFNAVFLITINDLTSIILIILCIIALLYQLVLGIGAGVPYTYMSESFSYSRKIYLCAIIFIVESLIQIIIYVSVDLSIPSDGCTFFTAFLQILIAVAIFKFLPETSCRSLKDSKELMRKLY